MALKTFVKLNSITNLTDARYGAGMYVDLLGFNLDNTSEKFTSPDLFKEITGWVSGVEFVGEFNHDSDLDLLEMLKDYPTITWIETDRIVELRSLVDRGYSLIYKISVAELNHLQPEVAKILSESNIVLHVVSENESFTESELATLKKLSEQFKVMLGSGVSEENVLDLVEGAGIFGISLSGGTETKPGLMDLDELAEILEKLEVDE